MSSTLDKGLNASPGGAVAGSGEGAFQGGRSTPTWRQRLSRFDLKASPYLYISPFFLLFALVGLFPLVYTFYVAMYDWDLLSGKESFVGLENFSTALTDGTFWNSIENTISIFALSTFPQLLGALVIAALLDQQIRAKTAWRMGVLLPYVVTPVAVALIFSSIFRNAGDSSLANNILDAIGLDQVEWKRDRLPSHIAIASMVNWRWTGYNALILLSAMQAVPRELYEAAAIDGAGPVRRFFSVTLPNVRPTLLFVIVTATVYGLQIFAEPRLYDVANAGGIGGAERQFQTTVLYLWEMAFFRRNLGRASAVALLLFVLIVSIGLVNFFISKRLVAGDEGPKLTRAERRAIKRAAEARKAVAR
ncbi:carbohydrate ABC transporter permease [Actinotalea fermentans]|uniref:Sugar ABC transporter permease n=1 Tax=Actinotalea fermentans TaxID=43671 RepID=A0A511YWH0_9CELL|nr:sugar ABC transporter permease [Actinotalea fermentans]KGM17521.1 ABC transporter permease [Actinotalea fermentans ATCC 43279 = JCM 9966 = DSM 3133]GEN79476.1 sugar ABC transporter permease [Actinotalea fermentans]